MVKSLKYRLFPTGNQKRSLQGHLNECRWLYNHFLEQRKNLWENEKKNIGFHEQCISIVGLKKDRESLTTVYAQVLQNVADRIDKSFANFFRRIKKGGEAPGYPRFKGFDRYDSFTYTQSGFKTRDGRLELSKIGSIKIKLHRPIIGTVKTCTIRRKSDKWYACFSVEAEPKILRKNNRAVGIDLGLESFAHLSTNKRIENPRFFRTDEKALAKAQRKFSKIEKGTPERKPIKKIISRIHERIANRRHNFTHQESRKIVNRFGIICVEDLNIKGMLRNHHLAKSIADASWNQFAQILASKAEEAGRKFVAVDPRGTSQRCSRCGIEVKKTLKDRWHDCPVCGLRLHRDYNASLNILALGLQSLGIQSIEAPSL